MGITFALLALLSWGIGDFLLQKSARRFGDWDALLYITLFASVLLLPFIWNDLELIFAASKTTLLLFFCSIVLLFAAMLDLEALRVGKISVVEPIYALEVPVTAALASVLLGERLDTLQTFLIITLVAGIFLVATKSFSHFKHIHTEKGAWLAILATICMGLANFLFAVSARATSPLLINWFTSIFILTITFTYLIFNKKLAAAFAFWRNNKKLIIGVGIIDNLAWIFYGLAVLYIPVAIAIGISESYILLAAGLGVIYNKEKLQRHQFFGMGLCVVSVIVLSLVTK